MKFLVRPVVAEDCAAIAEIADATLFPSDMLAPMIAPYLTDPESRHLWSVATIHNRVVGFTYCEPERMTEGTWNLLAIAITPDLQGRGGGASLVASLEAELGGRGARILIVETSGLDAYARTRAFYAGLGYELEARIRDFYAAGEDKIVFRKAIS